MPAGRLSAVVRLEDDEELTSTEHFSLFPVDDTVFRVCERKAFQRQFVGIFSHRRRQGDWRNVTQRANDHFPLIPVQVGGCPLLFCSFFGCAREALLPRTYDSKPTVVSEA